MIRHRFTLRSRLAEIDRATLAVSAFADEARLGPRARVALTLVLEGLVSNTVAHGGGDTRAAIEVELLLEEAAVRVYYSDGGRAFDPARDLPADDRHLPAEQRRVGGLGWPLIRGYCTDLRYRREGGRNRLELLLPLSAPPRG